MPVALRLSAVLTLSLLTSGCGAGTVGGLPDLGPAGDGAPQPDQLTTADAPRPTEAGSPDAGLDLPSPPKDGAPKPACHTVGAWQSSAPFISSGSHVAHPLPSFASKGYYYVHTMKKGGSERRLYAAKAQASGGLAAWKQSSSDHGGGPHGFTAIDVEGSPFHFRNGHIARYDFDASGVMQGDVKLVENSTSAAFGGNKYVWDSAVLARLPGGQRFVFHLGGFSFSGYTYRHEIYRSAVPVQSAFTKTGRKHPGARPGKAAFWAPSSGTAGYIFTGEAQGRGLWRTRVQASGQLDPFVKLPDLPQGSGNGRGDLFVHGKTLFSIRGATVSRAVISGAGTLSGWLSAPALPGAQVDVSWGDGHLEGQASGIIGAWVYVTGPTRVYYAQLKASTVCGP